MLSLLFTASAPQKADVSEMLVPSLQRLLGICRRHQKTKQDRLNELKDAEKKHESKEVGNKSEKEGSKIETQSEKPSADDETTRAPPNKRRRGEDVTTSSETGECSTEKPSAVEEKGTGSREDNSTGESSKGNQSRKAAQTIGSKSKLSGQLIRKIHSDWVDSLAKIIESVMTKVPK